MPAFGPVSRHDLIHYLRALGFRGPVAGSRHDYMEGRGRRVRIPNPHTGDISRGLVGELLRQAGVSRAEWEAL
jgi:predicted RNA binding protein YcfA (HicA-like mRNA interferase family)